jgi:hypothetical protein
MLRSNIRLTDGVARRAFWKKFNYLKDQPVRSPNQLKWKQALNQLLGSSRNDSRLIDTMGTPELMKIASEFAGFHSQARRHEIFRQVSSRINAVSSRACDLTNDEILIFLQALLESSLDVVDSETKRFRSAQIRECITDSHSVITVLLSTILSRDLSPEESVKFMYLGAIAQSKGWFDFGEQEAPLSDILDACLKHLRTNYVDFSTRSKTLWAVGRLKTLGRVAVSDEGQAFLRRSVIPQELLRFDVTSNFTIVQPANASEFHHLLQLEEACTHLGFTDTLLSNELGTVIDKMTKENRDPRIETDLIWWCAQSESGVHKFLADWMTTCVSHMKLLSENDRWKCVNGFSHVVDIAKRNRSMEDLETGVREKINFLIRAHVRETNRSFIR